MINVTTRVKISIQLRRFYMRLRQNIDVLRYNIRVFTLNRLSTMISVFFTSVHMIKQMAMATTIKEGG